MRKLLLSGCFLFVFVSAIRAQNPTGVNDVELNGDYAFTFNGITGGPGYSVVFAAVGRFTADGNGNLTNGEVDTNGIGGGAVLSVSSSPTKTRESAVLDARERWFV